MGKYVVLFQIGGLGDKEILLPGAVIETPKHMAQSRADIHVERGNLRPVDGTEPPAEKKAKTAIFGPGEREETQAEEPTQADSKQAPKAKG